MTVAPRAEATSEVRSVEALSTTMTSSTKSGMARSTRSRPCSSLRQGMMTVIDWPLYIRLFGSAARHIMRIMKRICLLLCSSAALTCAADLSSVHSVYILPMARGLDQYLANRLTGEHIFQVVTDPKLADAVFTERIGEPFQAQMQNL